MITVPELVQAKTPIILNACGGKIQPLDIDEFKNYFLLNVDNMYECNGYDVEYILKELKNWVTGGTKGNTILNHRYDINEFLEKFYIFKFHLVTLYRFLEHVSFEEVPYFIYNLSTVTEPGSVLDVIVPDYEKLANMLLVDETEMEIGGSGFEAHNILLTTEMLNTPNDPHASIWTGARLRYFFELEKRFRIENIDYNYKFDNRDIYMRAIITRI